jgi:hypothetical protein
MGWTTGPRLIDCWFAPADGALLAIVDGPDESSFTPLIETTASALGVSEEDVALEALTDMRNRWAFGGEPAVEDSRRRNPRPTRWSWIDVGPDDQTLRVQFIHGIPDGLHHIELYEDDEEVRVTVYLGLNHDWTGGGYVLVGITAWATVTTARPVAHRYINDGAEVR